jgi:hypothetical protein
MAHVQRRGKNRYRARYIAPDGRERSRTFTRRVEAERFLAAVETAKLRGEWRDPRLGRVTFAKWADPEPPVKAEPCVAPSSWTVTSQSGQANSFTSWTAGSQTGQPAVNT